MFVAKRCLVFNCVWEIKEGMSSILFRFYLLAFLLGSQRVLSTSGFPWQLTPAIQRDSGGGRDPDLNVVATRISMSKADSGRGMAGPPLLISTPTCQPPASLCSPPASNRRMGLGYAPSLLLQVLSQRGTPQLLAHTSSCVWRRAEGRWCRGHQGPIVRGLPFPTHPSFLSCPVLLRWVIAGGTL